VTEANWPPSLVTSSPMLVMRVLPVLGTLPVLRLVAVGLTYPQIAARLTLSVRTVQNHVQNTLAKLQLHNKAQLVRYALENDVAGDVAGGDDGAG